MSDVLDRLDEAQAYAELRRIASNWPKYHNDQSVEPDTIILTLLDDIESLRHAVEFYAEPDHWNEEGVCETRVNSRTTEWDEGWVARKALGMNPIHPRNREGSDA